MRRIICLLGTALFGLFVISSSSLTAQERVPLGNRADVAARPVVVDAGGRQRPGSRPSCHHHHHHCKRDRGCRWNFGLNFLFTPPVCHFPPPPPPPVICVERPPIVCYERVEVPSCNTTDNNARSLDLVARNSAGDRISLDGRYPNLESVGIDVEAPCLRLQMEGDYPQLTEVKVKSGSGDVKAKLRGCFSKADELAFSSATGDLDLDLRGRWLEDCTIDVTTNSGDIHLRLPSQVGVIVKVDGMCDRVISKEFRCFGGDCRSHREYSNHQYDNHKTALTVYVKAHGGRLVID